MTNSPYSYIVAPKMLTGIISFSAFAESMRAVVQALCGELSARRLNFDPAKAD